LTNGFVLVKNFGHPYLNMKQEYNICFGCVF